MSANDAHEKILRAVQLLSDAAKLLNDAGAAIALNRSRLALASAKEAARRVGELKVGAARSKRPAVRVMPSARNELIREDGSLRYLSYMRPAGQRPAVVAISFRVRGLAALTTTFSLDGREFRVVYEAAVRALAKHVGVTEDIELVASMLSSREAFLKRYQL